MTARTCFALAALVIATASPAWSAFSDRPATPPTSPSEPSAPLKGALTPRQQAEQWYGDAYDDVARARQDAAAGKAKSAEKRFGRALERARRATELDSTYHEAWNLVGFAARHMNDLPQSLAAYRTCLRLAPDYAPAREYYGEALAQSGDLAGAEKQLEWLRAAGHADLAAELDRSLTPRRAAGEGKAAVAPADSVR